MQYHRNEMQVFDGFMEKICYGRFLNFKFLYDIHQSSQKEEASEIKICRESKSNP